MTTRTQHHSRSLPRTPSEMMAVLHRSGKGRCLVCGRAPFNVAIWFPTASVCRELGLAEGERRSVGYCLCKRCSRRGPAAMKQAEGKIIAEARALLRKPEAN
jgi:hypothetical protein